MTFLLPSGSQEDLGLTTRGGTFGGPFGQSFYFRHSLNVSSYFKTLNIINFP